MVIYRKHSFQVESDGVWTIDNSLLIAVRGACIVTVYWGSILSIDLLLCTHLANTTQPCLQAVCGTCTIHILIRDGQRQRVGDAYTDTVLLPKAQC